ncbi:MAG: hypothetical protein IIY06_00630 [Proteobacteria bacterium]|jgi:ATP diphosphatase|nr:hypothetical protein [Pseudomonadota bacterium]
MTRDISPAQRGYRISADAAKIGFDWNDPIDVIPKLREEIDEIEIALKNQDRLNLIEEVGDLFFAIVNFNRKAHIDSDDAFHRGVDKFERRYKRLLQFIDDSGRDIHSFSQEELESLWHDVKKEEKNAR